VTTLKITGGDPASVEADVLVVAVTDDNGPRVLGDTLSETARTAIAGSLDSVGCDAEAGHHWRVPAPPGVASRSVLAVGVPPASGAAALREAAGTGLRASRGARSVVVAFPDPDGQALPAIAEGAMLGAHRPLRIGRHDGTAPAIVTVSSPAADARRESVAKRVVSDWRSSPWAGSWRWGRARRTLRALSNCTTRRATLSCTSRSSARGSRSTPAGCH
jgi:hypothetical protein